MKIELILTGGTIGSSAGSENVLRTDTSTKSNALIDNLFESQQSYEELIDFNISMPLDLLSENLTFAHWNKLINHIKTIDFSKTDGLIITHGSDTLAFTANLLALLFDGIDIPVFVVASAKPLTDKNANGYINFKKAVDMIIEGTSSGVYVPFLNRDGNMNVHEASRLIQAYDLSPDFESCHPKLNSISYIRELLNSTTDSNAVYDISTPILKQWRDLKANILSIAPQPGLDYRNYDLDYVDAVLHRTYHSSTMAVDTGQDLNNSILSLKKKCDEKGIPIYITPVLSSSKQIYESTDKTIKRGITPLYDMTFEMSYVYLCLKINA